MVPIFLGHPVSGPIELFEFGLRISNVFWKAKAVDCNLFFQTLSFYVSVTFCVHYDFTQDLKLSIQLYKLTAYKKAELSQR